jgi:hypothetical protein
MRLIEPREGQADRERRLRRLISFASATGAVIFEPGRRGGLAPSPTDGGEVTVEHIRDASDRRCPKRR